MPFPLVVQPGPGGKGVVVVPQPGHLASTLPPGALPPGALPQAALPPGTQVNALLAF